jgi:hypothetical protein
VEARHAKGMRHIGNPSQANIGRSCVRFKRLDDLDQASLKKLIREGAQAGVAYDFPTTSTTNEPGFMVRCGRFDGSAFGVSVYSAAGR